MSATALCPASGVLLYYEFSDSTCHQIPNFHELEYDIHADAIALCPAPGANWCPSQLRDYRRHIIRYIPNYYELAPGEKWCPSQLRE